MEQESYKFQRDLGDDDIQRYLTAIGGNKPLSSPAEAALAVRIRQGDVGARNKLVEANLLFVVSVAMEYKNKGIPLGDLINAGNVGLMTAAERFDESKKCRFISYAVWWIRQAILLAFIEEKRVVRLPINRIDFLRSAYAFMDQFLNKFERPATTAEIAAEFGISIRYAEETLLMGQSEYSLDANRDDDDERSFHEIVGDTRQGTAEELHQDLILKEEVAAALGLLENDREREVIQLYFGLNGHEPVTLEEIGQRFRVTRERIRQIRDKALRKLRHPSRSGKLRPYHEELV